MLREIKFRCFEDGKMFYSDSQDDAKILGAKLGSSLMSTFFNQFYCHNNLMQFTGLKDNKRTKEFPNGQDIYEGDVMKTKRFRESINMITETVSFEDGCFVTFTDFDITVPLSYHELLDIEIIGNIHEQSKEVSNA